MPRAASASVAPLLWGLLSAACTLNPPDYVATELRPIRDDAATSQLGDAAATPPTEAGASSLDSGIAPVEAPLVLGCAHGSTRPCGPSTEAGICRLGTRFCEQGVWGECFGAIHPGERLCTSDADNDCDGQPDNVVDDVCRCVPGSAEACGAHPGLDGHGPCQAGQRLCVPSSNARSSDWGACNGSVGPSPAADSCLVPSDADCDDVPNEGCTCVEGSVVECGPPNAGVCRKGTSTCVGLAYAACEGAVFPGARDCSSAADHDCDGKPDNTIDASCSCSIGETRPCDIHEGFDTIGLCRAGEQRCVPGPNGTTSGFDECTGAVAPALADSCASAGDDSNCDGVPNGGCACVAGQGNLPCAANPAASRCDERGTCVPCLADGDCALIASRGTCANGLCIAPEVADAGTEAGPEPF